jgi:hypothetical protein
MNWRLIKAFPKIAIVVGVFGISTTLFGIWWFTRSTKTPASSNASVASNQEASSASEVKQQKAATLPAKMGWLALVGSDLYDISTGERLFPNWLRGIPQKLFFQASTNRLMALTERGVIRFALDGSNDGTLGGDAPPAFTHDGKQAMFVKNGDVWVTDVYWQGFKFTNERQATKLGQFNAPFFAANVMLGSAKNIVVRNQNALVRVSLLTGEVQPMKLPLSEIGKRRSPDGGCVVGEFNRQLYAYDVDVGDAFGFPKGRDSAVDFQWLDNQRCAFIVSAKGVAYYERGKNTLVEVAALPFACNKIAGPSPDGRYVLCAGRGGVVIVDVTEKRAEAFGTPAQHFGWLNGNTLVYSRDVPDTSVRGTWLRTMGGMEKQITSEPYVIGRDGSGAVAVMKDVNAIVFATSNALFRMKPDGSELQEIAKLPAPVQRLQAVEIWGE